MGAGRDSNLIKYKIHLINTPNHHEFGPLFFTNCDIFLFLISKNSYTSDNMGLVVFDMEPRDVISSKHKWQQIPLHKKRPAHTSSAKGIRGENDENESKRWNNNS